MNNPINWNKVKAIVFDLGNVVIDLDNDYYGKGWPNTLLRESMSKLSDEERKQLWYDYETGQIQTDDFLKTLHERTGLSELDIRSYWNKILVGIQPHVYDLLKELGQQYPLYVLSNTNEMHIQWVLQHVAEAGQPNFEEFFRKRIYSYEAGAVKPEPEIYAYTEAQVKDDAEITSEGLLFIDDKIENVEAARKRGWQAIHLALGEDLLPVFAQALTS